MPIGITTDVLITCLGAVLGVVLGARLPDSLKKSDSESEKPFSGRSYACHRRNPW